MVSAAIGIPVRALESLEIGFSPAPAPTRSRGFESDARAGALLGRADCSRARCLRWR
jgi:hypothetical protein